MSCHWRTIQCSRKSLNLEILTCGQAFRWSKIENDTWRGVLNDKIWSLKQDDQCIMYFKHDSDRKNVVNDLKYLDDEEILRNYFQLHVPLEQLQDKWVKKDPQFKNILSNTSGIRILRQNPIENLFSFICSSNNNIKRITSMVEKLSVHFGEKIGSLDGVDYYSFPTIANLANENVEISLRKLGFGYRAKFIHKSSKYILLNHDEQWLFDLRKKSYNEAKNSLMELPGVGAKVADCVCLMSLDKPAAVPVDTHIFKVAQSYLPHLRSNKSITTKLYTDIAEFFQTFFGEYAGWAQASLFASELDFFKHDQSKNVLPKKRSNDIKCNVQTINGVKRTKNK